MTGEQPAYDEWVSLLKGLRNNQPDIYREWGQNSRNDIRRVLREAFGDTEGDILRAQGYGAVHVGPLTRAAINRFIHKLASAIYYRHNRVRFEGVVQSRHITTVNKDHTPEDFEELLTFAPVRSESRRGGKSLDDQFVYRFNYSPDPGVLYAVVMFNPQMVFQIFAMSFQARKGLNELREQLGQEPVGFSGWSMSVSRS